LAVFDTTLFSQDFKTLEIRLEELWDVVDYFLICESNFAFSGAPKPYFLSESISAFEKYKSKLILIRFDRRVPNANPWMNEMLQRQEITKYLHQFKLSKSDFIMHSDCDEIPRKETVILARSQKEVNFLLEFRNYTYYLNLRNGVYARGRIISANKFKSVQNLRRDIFLHNLAGQRRYWLPFIRTPEYWTNKSKFLNVPQFVFRAPKLQLIQDAGWHFNNLLTPEEILNKVQWSAHQELNTPDIANIDHITNSIKNKRELYRGVNFQIEDVEEFMPTFIRENPMKFKSLIATDRET
jgi:beta-1,4-mannosyl-glycoprotein beta-1,4-N-acetylglucosaminyltransferase